ncbi:MAG: hypothetical protein IRZ06_12240 [Nevskia sp.]|nr:hypothetical protein [Nevskia sp.]
MREAMIVIPKTDNSGRPLDALIDSALAAACDQFGGATAVPAEGIWRSPTNGRVYREPVIQLMIAVDDTAIPALRSLAAIIAREGEQESVYLRLPSGDVEFVEGVR